MWISAQPVSRFAPPEAWATVHARLRNAPRGSQHLRLLNIQVCDRKVNLTRLWRDVALPERLTRLGFASATASRGVRFQNHVKFLKHVKSEIEQRLRSPTHRQRPA